MTLSIPVEFQSVDKLEGLSWAAAKVIKSSDEKRLKEVAVLNLPEMGI